MDGVGSYGGLDGLGGGEEGMGDTFGERMGDAIVGGEVGRGWRDLGE